MQYTVGNVIYGTYFPRSLDNVIWDHVRCRTIYISVNWFKDHGVTVRHSARTYQPAWIGPVLLRIGERKAVPVSDLVEIHRSLDEKGPMLKLTIAEQIAQFPKEIQDGLPPIDLYIVWSSQ